MLQIISKREERQLIVSCKELRNALHSNVAVGRIGENISAQNCAYKHALHAWNTMYAYVHDSIMYSVNDQLSAPH